MADSVDFFSVSLSITRLKTQFNRREISDIVSTSNAGVLIMVKLKDLPDDRHNSDSVVTERWCRAYKPFCLVDADRLTTPTLSDHFWCFE